MFISQAFNKKKLLGTGMSHKKKEARERAADKALATLAEQGVVKDVPQQYKNLVQPY
jgi:dsRNA-specific ribonuclease